MKVISLNENILIESSIVCELLASMFRLECHEKLLPQSQQRLKYVPEALKNWVDKSRLSLTSTLKEELSIFFNFESFLGMSLIQVVIEKGCHKDIAQFFNFLDQYPSEDLVKNFFTTGFGQDAKLTNIHDLLEVKAYLDKASIPEIEKWKLLYFCSCPDKTKDRFINLVKKYYNLIFKNTLDMLDTVYAESVNKLEEKLQTNPFNTISKLIDYDFATNNDNITLIPSYYYNTASLLSFSEEDSRLIYLYGTACPEIAFSEDISSEKVLNAIKVLSDENRIKTIELLNQGPCYGYELSQKLGISSSTISHHLSLLNDIEVITSFREENKVYYKVNKDTIRKILKQFEAMLT